MADEFDGMDDLDDILGEEPDFGDDPNAPDDRTPTEKAVSDATTVVSEAADPVKLGKTLGKSVLKSMPNNIDQDVDRAVGVYDKGIEALEKNTDTLRKAASGTLGTVADLLPESLAGPVNRLREFINIEDPTSGSSGPSEDENISSEVSALMGETLGAEAVQSKINADIQQMTSKNQNELLANIAANTKQLTMYKSEFDNKFQKRSLELQIKQTLTAVKTYELLTKSTEKNIAQLDAIVKNTALPDFLKATNSEVLKEKARDQLFSAGSSMFKKTDVFQNFSKGFESFANEQTSKITDALGMADMAVDGVAMGADMGIGPLQMLMDTVLGSQIDKASDATAKFMLSQLVGNDGYEKGTTEYKKFMSDPAMGAKKLADKLDKEEEDKLRKEGKLGENETYEGSFKTNAIRKTADMFGRNIDSTNVNIGDTSDMMGAGLITKKMVTAVDTTIPSLLSKILSEVTTIRKGNNVIDSEDELLYDYKNNTFTNKAKKKKEYKKKIAERTKSVTDGVLSKNIPEQLLPGASKEETVDIAQAVIAYTVSGKSPSPYFLIEDGFLDYIKNDDLKAKLQTSLNSLVDAKTPKDRDKLTDLQSDIESVRNSVSSYADLADEANLLGTSDILQDVGLTDKDSATSINNSNILNTINKDSETLLNEAVKDKDFTSNKVIDDNTDNAQVTDATTTVTESNNIDDNRPSNIGKNKKSNKKGNKKSNKRARSGASRRRGKRRGSGKSRRRANKIVDTNAVNADGTHNFFTGGYTGDGGKYVRAGNVHRSEFVLSQSELNSLVTSATSNDKDAIVKQVDDIVTKVDKASDKINTVFTSGKDVMDKASVVGKETYESGKELAAKAYNKTKAVATEAWDNRPKSMEDIEKLYDQALDKISDVTKVVSTKVTEVMDKVPKTFEEAGELLGNIGDKITGTVDNVIDNFPKSFSEVKDVLGDLGTSISDKFTSIKEHMPKSLLDLGESVSNFGSSISSELGKAYDKLPDSIKDIGTNIKEAFDGMPKTLEGIKESMSETFYSAKESMVRMVSDMPQSVQDALKTVGETFYSVKDTVTDAFKDLPKTFSDVKKSMTDAFSDLPGTFNSIKETIAGVAGDLPKTLSSVATTMKDTISDLPKTFREFSSSVSETFSSMTNSFNNIFGEQIKTISDFTDNMFKDGTALGSMKNTVVNAYKSSTETINNAATKQMENFTNQLVKHNVVTLDKDGKIEKINLDGISETLSKSYDASLEFAKEKGGRAYEFITNKEDGLSSKVSSAVISTSKGTSSVIKDISSMLGNTPDISEEMVKNMKDVNELINTDGVEVMIKKQLKGIPLPESYFEAVRAYKPIFLTLDPSGTLWDKMSKEENFIEDIEKLHVKSIAEEEKGLIGRAGDLLDKGTSKAGDIVSKLRDDFINNLPKPLQGPAKKLLDNRFTKYLGKTGSKLKKVAKGALGTTFKSLKAIGSEGKAMFRDPETGEFRMPTAYELSKFAVNSSIKTTKAAGEGVREMYTGIGGIAKDTAKLGLKTASDITGITRTAKNIKHAIKPPINRKLYKAWSGGKMTAEEVKQQLKPDEQDKWVQWLEDNKPVGFTLLDILSTGGSWSLKATKLASKGVRSSYTLAGRATGKVALTGSKTILKGTAQFLGMGRLFKGSKAEGAKKINSLTTFISKDNFKYFNKDIGDTATAMSIEPEAFNLLTIDMDKLNKDYKSLLINKVKSLDSKYTNARVYSDNTEDMLEEIKKDLESLLLALEASLTDKDKDGYVEEEISTPNLKAKKLGDADVEDTKTKAEEDVLDSVKEDDIKDSTTNVIDGLVPSFLSGIKDSIVEYVSSDTKSNIVNATSNNKDYNDSKDKTGTNGQYYVGGYTGDGGKFVKAGTVHKGEDVLSQEDVKTMVSSAVKGDRDAMVNQVESIVTKIDKNSDKINTKFTSKAAGASSKSKLGVPANNDVSSRIELKQLEVLENMNANLTKQVELEEEKIPDKEDKQAEVFAKRKAKDDKRLDKLYGKGSDEKEKKPSIFSRAKDAVKDSGIFTKKNMLMVGLGIMGAMGITTKDIKGFFSGVGSALKGTWNVLKDVYEFIKPVATGIWDAMKSTWKFLKKSFYYIKESPNSISLYMRNALSHIYGLGSLAPTASEIAAHEQRLKTGTDAPSMKVNASKDDEGKNDDGSERGETTGKAVVAGAAGATALKVRGKIKARAETKRLKALEKVEKARVTKIAEAAKKKPSFLSKMWSSAKNVAKEKVSKAASAAKSLVKKGASKVTGIAKKLASKFKPPKISKVRELLKKIGVTLAKKVGKRGASKIVGKLLAKLVPGLGWGLLAYDGAMIAKDMITNGTGLGSAVSKQLIGFDVFDIDATPIDKDGNPIKPELSEDDIETEEKRYKERYAKGINNKPANKPSYEPNSTIYGNTNKPVNNVIDNATNNGKFNPTDLIANKLKVNIKPSKPITNKEVLGEFTVDGGFNKGKLIGDLVRDEGLVKHVYKDSLGYDTIGVGHLLDKKKGGIPLKKIIGADKNTISTPEAYKVLAHDANATAKELYTKAPWIEKQPEPVQRSLVNMGFNIGVGGLLKFKKSLGLIKDREYHEAGKELLRSRWAKQVGPRATRLASTIANAPTAPVGDIDAPSSIRDKATIAVNEHKNNMFNKANGLKASVNTSSKIDSTKTTKPLDKTIKNNGSKHFDGLSSNKKVNIEKHTIHVAPASVDTKSLVSEQTKANETLNKQLMAHRATNSKLDQLIALQKEALGSTNKDYVGTKGKVPVNKTSHSPDKAFNSDAASW